MRFDVPHYCLQVLELLDHGVDVEVSLDEEVFRLMLDWVVGNCVDRFSYIGNWVPDIDHVVQDEMSVDCEVYMTIWGTGVELSYRLKVECTFWV